MSTHWQNRIVSYGTKAADQFTANPANPRLHPQYQRDVMKAVLDKLGWIAPVIENQRTGYLVDGHERVMQALVRNEAVPYVVVDLTPEEEATALATFDPITALATYDRDALDSLLRDVATDSAVVDKMLAELAEANGLYPEQATPIEDAGAQLDRAGELQEKWQVKRGDLWQIGNHRLLCGDSTNADDVARLMAGEKAGMMVTDPPYNVDYEGSTKDALIIANDSMSEADFRSFLVSVFKLADIVLRNGGVYYIAHSDAFAYEFIGAVRDIGWVQARPPTIQWIKDSLVLGRGDYHSRSEPILYGWKPGAAHFAVKDRSQDNVWEIPRPKSSESHPTMKPVELVTRALGNSSSVYEIVYDPFLGSGTTLVACEQTGRKGRGLEIEPKYCSVILERMAAMGLTLQRISENE